jgi:hypothetical protein
LPFSALAIVDLPWPRRSPRAKRSQRRKSNEFGVAAVEGMRPPPAIRRGRCVWSGYDKGLRAKQTQAERTRLAEQSRSGERSLVWQNKAEQNEANWRHRAPRGPGCRPIELATGYSWEWQMLRAGRRKAEMDSIVDRL